MSAIFNFTKLVVADLEKSFAFYRDVCGFTEQQRVRSAIAGRAFEEIIMAGRSPKAPSLILVAFDDRRAPAPGETILGLFTRDLAGFVEHAQRQGGTLLQAAHHVPDMKFTVAFVQDPEGHLLEVIQQDPK